MHVAIEYLVKFYHTSIPPIIFSRKTSDHYQKTHFSSFKNEHQSA